MYRGNNYILCLKSIKSTIKFKRFKLFVSCIHLRSFPKCGLPSLYLTNIFVTNSRKIQRRSPMCSAVDRAAFTIRQCVSPCSLSPPLYHLHWGVTSVSLRTLKCQHLRSGTSNSFILPQMSTLATNAANV